MKKVSTSERLKEAMRETKMKQVDLARETGLDRGAISSYLSGKYDPKQNAINKMAIALNVSEMWLWGYDVPKERTPDIKKNDDLVKIIALLRKDTKFYNLVYELAELPEEQRDSIATIVSALGKK